VIELVCPECGAEYRPGVTECADCLVALVDPATLVPETERHETVTYEIADWPSVKFDVLRLQLSREEIPFELHLRVLKVPKAHEETVDALIDDIDADNVEPLWEPDDTEDGAPDNLWPEATVRGPVSSGDIDRTGGLGRRLGAGVIDALLASATYSLLGALLLNLDSWTRDDLDRIRLLNGLLAFVYQVVCVGRWGQTVGKRVAGIKVVVLQGQGIWLAAVLRAGVTGALFGLDLLPAGGVKTALLFAGVVWTLAIYLPILFREDHRGTHDLVAGTMVVRV
jgi:uncharacterized RDD family membrane protein YckC